MMTEIKVFDMERFGFFTRRWENLNLVEGMLCCVYRMT